MNRVVKWIVRIIGALLALIVLLVAIIYFRSQSVVNARYAIPEINIPTSTDEAAIKRGEHLARAVSVCVDCHGDNLEGDVVVDDPLIGYVAAPNLTKGQGGLGNELSDMDMARALRYGVKKDGHSVLVMPSDDYQHLSDEDLGTIIAWVRTMPAVDKEWTTFRSGPLGRVLLTLGQLPIITAAKIDMDRQHPATMKAEVTKEYGAYLANIAGCTGCHGPGLSGGPIPGAPPDWPIASNLTPSGDLGKWTEADFIQTIRSGINPAGKALNPIMPWPRYGTMSDDELKTLWLSISSVPAKEAGTR